VSYPTHRPCDKLISVDDLAAKNEVAELVRFIESNGKAQCSEAVLVSCGHVLNTNHENFEIRCKSDNSISKIKIRIRKNKSRGLFVKKVLLSTKY